MDITTYNIKEPQYHFERSAIEYWERVEGGGGGGALILLDPASVVVRN